MHWSEISAEDGLGNPTCLRLRSTSRGLAILVPARAAATVLHVPKDHIGNFVDELTRVIDELNTDESVTARR